MNYFKVIEIATKAVPATKYVLPVVALFAGIAIVISFQIDLRIAFWGSIVFLGLMILIVVFARLTQTAPGEFKYPVKFLMWAFVILFVLNCTLLSSSIFFKKPLDLEFFINSNAARGSTPLGKTEERANSDSAIQHSQKPPNIVNQTHSGTGDNVVNKTQSNGK